MRQKVTINLSTDDPLEAEILDMLSGVPTSHRKQERLRGILKSGYNLLYKNMNADRAMAEAFDKQDVALILALFGRNGAPAVEHQESSQRAPQLIQEPAIDYRRPEPKVIESPPAREEKVAQAVAPILQPDQPISTETVHEVRTVNTRQDSRSAYKEIAPIHLEEEKVELVDFDPGLLELEKPEPVHAASDEYVDPLKRLLNKG
jgi:hypothetical protein